MPTERQQDEVRDHIALQLLPAVRPSATDWKPGNVSVLRNRLHLLRHFCAHTEFEEAVIEILDSLLILSGELWQLLLDDAANQASKSEYRRVRTLSAEAEGLGNFEELMSGEDTVRDIIINSIAFALNWKSNTIWMDEAVKERVGIAQTGLTTLQDHIWHLLDARTTPQPTLEFAQASEMARSIEQLWELMGSLQADVQIRLLIQIYVQLIRLELGRLISTLP